jgi:hypothetical protein
MLVALKNFLTNHNETIRSRKHTKNASQAVNEYFMAFFINGVFNQNIRKISLWANKFTSISPLPDIIFIGMQ